MQKIFSLRQIIPFFFVRNISTIILSFSFVISGESALLEESTGYNHRPVPHILEQRPDEDMGISPILSDRNSVWAYSIFSSAGVGVALSALFGNLEDNLYAMIPCVMGCMITGSVIGHMIRNGMAYHDSMANYSHFVAFMVSIFPWLIVSSLEYARFQSQHPESFIR